MNYYNENDPDAAAWLAQLVADRHVPAGIVDTRSIVDVAPSDLACFTQCHFFAGIGGWSLALQLAGWPADRPVWSGSCPCQPFSALGNRAGIADDRHLWPAWWRLASVARPNVIFGEQVSTHDGLAWFDCVSRDMENEAYAVGSLDTCAAGVGHAHARQRLYFVGMADADHVQRSCAERSAREEGQSARWHKDTGTIARRGVAPEWRLGRDGSRWAVEPGTFPLVNGIPARVVRLRGYGNAINVEQAATFIKAVMDL